MSSKIFIYIYLGGIVLRPLIRLPAFLKAGRGAIREDRADFRERLLMVLLLVGMFVCPLLALGPWLSESAYALPAWASWSGVVLYLLATGLLWRAHVDLGRSYSPTVRIREGQRLVTSGVYGWIRHPIYAAHWLIAIAQVLLVHHWIYGLSGLVAWSLLYFYRLPREEAMMIKVYGQEYRAYMERVGAILPMAKPTFRAGGGG
jgi:protein-S-isoprenylcysteine O-methyltransferase Ste14